jgi:hypothetical protein
MTNLNRINIKKVSLIIFYDVIKNVKVVFLASFTNYLNIEQLTLFWQTPKGKREIKCHYSNYNNDKIQADSTRVGK